MAEDRVVTLGGRRVAYLVRGPRDGRPVVYLHGMPGSRLEQRVLPDEVLERFGVRLVSIDRPGWGKTDPLPGNRVERVGDVVAVCDALGIESFPVLAVSAGGAYAVALAATSPDRVERLVLSSAQMPYDDEAAIAGLQPGQLALLPLLRERGRESIAKLLEGARGQMLEDPLAGMAAMTATLSAPEREWFEQTWVEQAFADDVREGLRARVDGMLEDMLRWPQPLEVDPSAVRCPVRAVHGTHDDWEPLANLRRMVELMPDTQLILLEGLNHFGPLLYPDLLVSLTVAPCLTRPGQLPSRFST